MWLLLLTGCDSAPGDSAPRPSDTGERSDLDGDGFAAPEDCDDTDPEVFPGAYEPRDDGGVDRDCNGEDGAFTVLRTTNGGYVLPSPDVNGDGAADMIAMDYFTPVWFTKVWASYASWIYVEGFWYPVPLDDLDGDGLAEIVGFTAMEDGRTWAVTLFTGEFMAREEATPGLEPELVCEAPDQDNTSLGQLDDMDGDGVAELQVGSDVYPAGRFLSAPCDLGEPGFRFPEGPATGTTVHPPSHFESGDIDGDGLGDLLQPGLIYAAASLSPGGTYYASDGISVPGLAGYVEDVNGDGLDDVWLYDGAGYGQVELAVAATRLGESTTTFATVAGSEAFFVPEEAGPIGDVDEDGRSDVAIGAEVGGPAKPWEVELQEVRLFPAVAMSGSVDIEASPRRIALDGYRFTHADFNADGVADPVVLGPVDLSVIGWAPIFP